MIERALIHFLKYVACNWLISELIQFNLIAITKQKTIIPVEVNANSYLLTVFGSYHVHYHYDAIDFWRNIVLLTQKQHDKCSNYID